MTFARQHVTGLVGFDFISQFVIEIDYEKKLLTLHDNAEFKYSGNGAMLPIIFNAEAHPQVNAQVIVEGRELKPGAYVLDVGAGDACTLHATFVKEQHLLTPDRVTVASQSFGTGGHLNGPVGRIDALRLGNWLIKKPFVQFSQDSTGAYSSTGVQGSIGGEILSRFHVFLDYRRKQVILEPTSQLSKPFEFDMSGLSLQSFDLDFRRYKIIAVADHSPGSEAGLKQGDILVTIDRRPSSQFSLDELRHMFRRETKYDLGIQRSDAVIATTITLRRRI